MFWWVITSLNPRRSWVVDVVCLAINGCFWSKLLLSSISNLYKQQEVEEESVVFMKHENTFPMLITSFPIPKALSLPVLCPYKWIDAYLYIYCLLTHTTWAVIIIIIHVNTWQWEYEICILLLLLFFYSRRESNLYFSEIRIMTFLLFFLLKLSSYNNYRLNWEGNNIWL